MLIPASTIKVMKADQMIANPGWPSINMPCYGGGVDSDQNVWGVSMGMSTRALVDAKGGITLPRLGARPPGRERPLRCFFAAKIRRRGAGAATR